MHARLYTHIYQFTYNLKLHETSHDIPLLYDWIVVTFIMKKIQHICCRKNEKYVKSRTKLNKLLCEKYIKHVPKSSCDCKRVKKFLCNKLDLN